MARDWINFPELRNSEISELYFESPHKQIFEDFFAICVKVIDGDTIRLRWDERDFDFPLRMLGTDAPEMNEEGGEESQKWLEDLILNEKVMIVIDRNQRVGKFGRLLGNVFHRGINLNEDSIRSGFAKPFDQRNEAKLPDLNKELRIENWLSTLAV